MATAELTQETSFLERHHFLLRKLHSLSGLLPIGAFLVYHFYGNALVLAPDGDLKWNEHKEYLHGLPAFQVAEWCFVLLPIAFHAFYGLYIVYTGRGNQTDYPYFRNWMYVLQRWSGIFLTVFIAMHIAHLRGREALDYVDLDALQMFREFTWPIAAAYSLGVVAASFHFANGLWNMSITWGFATGVEAQKRVFQACMVLFAVLAIAGVATAVKFSSGFPFPG